MFRQILLQKIHSLSFVSELRVYECLVSHQLTAWINCAVRASARQNSPGAVRQTGASEHPGDDDLPFVFIVCALLGRCDAAVLSRSSPRFIGVGALRLTGH